MKKALLQIVAISFCGGCMVLENTYQPYSGKECDGMLPRKNIALEFEGDWFDSHTVYYGGATTDFRRNTGYAKSEVTATTRSALESYEVTNPYGEAIKEYFEKTGYTIGSSSPNYIIKTYPHTCTTSPGKGIRTAYFWGTLGICQKYADIYRFRVKVYESNTNTLLYDKESLFEGAIDSISFVPLLPFGFLRCWAIASDGNNIMWWKIKAIEDAIDSIETNR